LVCSIVKAGSSDRVRRLADQARSPAARRRPSPTEPPDPPMSAAAPEHDLAGRRLYS
jgi:hypothetical protein